MIVECFNCKKHYDDQFRFTYCPHATFPANNGQNWFAHYPQSWLGDNPPSIQENTAYINFLNTNKVQT